MNIIQKQTWKYKEKQYKKYQSLLLSGPYGLHNVPSWLLEDVNFTRTLHILAFRAARNISREWYLQEMEFLNYELLHAKLILKSDELVNNLQYCLNWATDMLDGLEKSGKI